MGAYRTATESIGGYTMNKKELIAKSAVMANLTKADTERALYALCETIASELHDGGQVRIGGFGIFCAKERKARKGINPQTGEEIDVPGRNVATFKASTLLKERLNS